MSALIVTEADAAPYARGRIEEDCAALITYVLPYTGASFEGFPPDRTPNTNRTPGTLWERVGERDADAEPLTPSGRDYYRRPRLGRLSTLDGWVHPPTTSHFVIRTYPRSAAHDLTAAR